MAEWIIMPKQGLQMTEGTIMEWFVKEGDAVAEGADLLSIETDKLTIDIQSTAGGTLLKILHPAGDTVPITRPIAVIGEPGEDIEAMLVESNEGEAALISSPEQPAAGAVRVAEVRSQSAGERCFATPRAILVAEQRGISYQEVPGTGPDGLVIERDILQHQPSAPVKFTPLAKKVAALEQVNLNEVSGTGSRDRITADDVRAAAARRRGGGARSDVVVPHTGMRRAVASRMKGSLAEMAQANHRVTVDMTESVHLRESLKQAGAKVSYNDIVLRCVARALTEHPMLNSSWSDEGIVQKGSVNLGMAVAVEGGLLVPVIRDADLLTLTELSAVSAELAVKAKENRLTPDEYSGGTFTVSNLGMFEIDSFTAIVNPPEAGILAVGKLSKQPAVVDDELVIRPLMQLSLTYDHRVVDGAPAAIFLRRVKELLQNPGLLI